jgi:hypothetical protein
MYNKSGEYAIWISVSAGSGSSSVFCGVFIAEEEDKGSGDTTMVDVQALLEA